MIKTPRIRKARTGQSASFPLSASLLLASLSLCLTLFAAASPARAKDMTAEEALRQLPPSIFENTDEPLGEEEKEQLLNRGYSRGWIVLNNHTDSLRLAAINDARTVVTVQLFRRKNGGMVVLGARNGDICAAELWNYGADGGLVPAPGPEDPTSQDFFAPGHVPPPGVHPTYHLCLDEEYPNLEARPQFWGPGGPVGVRTSNKVRYGWNGDAFIKHVSPADAP